MNIKIIPKEAGSTCYPLDKDLVLIIHERQLAYTPDEGVIPFRQVDYYILHTDTNVRESILPDIRKFMVAKLHFCEKKVTRLYFYYLEYTAYPIVTFVLFSYNLADHSCMEVMRYEDDVRKYEKERKPEIFALSNNYFLMQTQLLTANLRDTYKGYIDFELFLYDLKNRMRYDIRDNRLTSGGIMQLEPVAANVCAIRLGYSLAEDNRILHLMKKEAAEEFIGLITVSGFISEIMLGLPVFTMEYIDEVYFDRTLTHFTRQGKYIIYSRVNTDDLSQEIIFYDYVKKDTLVVANKNPYNEDDIIPCVLNRLPYLIRRKKKFFDFFCIRKNKVTHRLPSDVKIAELMNDFLAIRVRKKSLLGTGDEFFEFYRFSDMSRLCREKVVSEQCIQNGPGDILIFIEE